MRPSNTLDRGIFRAGQLAGAVHPGDGASHQQGRIIGPPLTSIRPRRQRWALTMRRVYARICLGGDTMITKRLICNVDEQLLARVDEYAQRLHITRTAAVAVLLSRGLESEGVGVAEQQKPTPT